MCSCMYEVMLKQKPRVAISDQNGVTVNTLAYTISATAGYMTSMFRPISVQTIGVRLYSGREVSGLYGYSTSWFRLVAFSTGAGPLCWRDDRRTAGRVLFCPALSFLGARLERDRQRAGSPVLSRGHGAAHDPGITGSGSGGPPQPPPSQVPGLPNPACSPSRAVRESPGRIAQQPWMANAQTCSQGTGLSPFGRMGILRLTKNRRFLAEATSQVPERGLQCPTVPGSIPVMVRLQPSLARMSACRRSFCTPAHAFRYRPVHGLVIGCQCCTSDLNWGMKFAHERGKRKLQYLANW